MAVLLYNRSLVGDKMRKFKIVVSIVLVLIISQASVFAAPRIPVYKDGNVYYFLDKATGTITGFAGEPVDVIIPTSLGGFKVLSVGPRAFAECPTLSTLSIPEGITLVSAEAFMSCPNLKSVEIGPSVSYIGSRAFANCQSLENVMFRGFLENDAIASDAFYDTAWLGSSSQEFVIFGGTILLKYNGNSEVVTVPEGIREIAESAFSYNSTVKEVILPSTLEKIGDNAFVHCYSLEKINIPASVSHIGAGAFDDTIWMYNQSGDFVHVNGILISYKGSDKHVEIPEGITAVGSGAFMANDFLLSVHLPSTVIYIDSMAFGGCSSVRLINIPPSVEWIDEYAFAGCVNLTVYGNPDSYAQKYAEYMEMPFSTEVYVNYNGNKVYFDNAVPIIYYERTYLPLRALMEMMGFLVSWDSATGNVTCVKGDRTVIITPDGQISVNGVISPTIAPPINKNGSNLVSARVIAEAVGAQVGWDENTRTVIITN